MAFSRVDPIPASTHSTSPPFLPADSSARRTARIVGVLFLAGYVAYGVGSLIAQGVVNSADRSGYTALFVTGAALMLLNSAFVIVIGVLMFPILRAYNEPVAAGYVGTRIFEGVVLAIGVVSLSVLTGSHAIDVNSVYYNVAEAGLGVGSLFFCALLFRIGLVPRFLAGWGFIGYACFAVGNLLALFGVAGAGLVGAVPGGLFEVTFAIWLIARGFASTATVRGIDVQTGTGGTR
jgi:MFS family permease